MSCVFKLEIIWSLCFLSHFHRITMTTCRMEKNTVTSLFYFFCWTANYQIIQLEKSLILEKIHISVWYILKTICDTCYMACMQCQAQCFRTITKTTPNTMKYIHDHVCLVFLQTFHDGEASTCLLSASNFQTIITIDLNEVPVVSGDVESILAGWCLEHWSIERSLSLGNWNSHSLCKLLCVALAWHWCK